MNRRRKPLLHVIADFAIGRVPGQQPAVRRAQPQLRHVIFIQENLPEAIHFAEVHVGLDEPRFRFVVAKPGPRIELLDYVQSALNGFQRPVQCSRDLFQLIGLHLFQVLGHNLVRQSVCGIKSFQLQQQAFPQIACANANGIEILHHRESIFQVILCVLAALEQFFVGSSQITVFVQVADDVIRNFAHGVGTNRHA